MLPFPSVPAVRDEQRATGSYSIRFEDLSQDGRVHFEPIVASIDASIWRPMLAGNAAARALRDAGVRPIFTRLDLEVGPAQLELGETLSAEGVYELAHQPDGKGGAERLFLNMWTTIDVVTSKRRKERARVGRLFAEHQLTRPHAPAGERRVVALPDGSVPRAEYRAARFESALDLPEGAAWLEPTASRDPTPLCFGLSHTDVNQHVNSLVYPRLFGDAALRRFASLGADTRTLAQRLRIAFRKPFFAGDAARIELRAYRDGAGELGALGTFGAAADDAKPHVYVQLGFSRAHS
jgi:hypothetical protein